MAELFDIDHETGDLSQYDETVTDGGDLSVEAAAALAGTNFGLQCFIDDANAIYGKVNQADPGTGKFRCRFYVDKHNLSLPISTYHKILFIRPNIDPWSFVVIWIMTDGAGIYRIAFRPYSDAGSIATDTFFITGVHYVEFYIVQASNDVAADGSAHWWVDGVLQGEWFNLDNYDVFRLMEYLTFGAGTVGAGAAGTYYLDQLKANDDGSEIGEHVAAAASRHNRPFIQIEGAERLYGLRRHAIW